MFLHTFTHPFSYSFKTQKGLFHWFWNRCNKSNIYYFCINLLSTLSNNPSYQHIWYPLDLIKADDVSNPVLAIHYWLVTRISRPEKLETRILWIPEWFFKFQKNFVHGSKLDGFNDLDFFHWQWWNKQAGLMLLQISFTCEKIFNKLTIFLFFYFCPVISWTTMNQRTYRQSPIFFKFLLEQC